MKQEQIQSLIDALAASELSELEYTEDGCTLRLSKTPTFAPLSSHGAEAANASQAEAGIEGGSTRSTAGGGPSAGAQAAQARAAECLAPLYGVVHLQPSPGEPAYVTEGQEIKAGQTLCVIEAMKVFNEVRAEHDLRLRSVLVQSGQEVEAGQPLFVFG